MLRRPLLTTLLLCAMAGAAHAQIGWEVEWDVELTQIEGDGMAGPAEGREFWIKQTLGQEGNWLITSDDVWDAASCSPELRALFPRTGALATAPLAPLAPNMTYGLFAFLRADQSGRADAVRKPDRCFKGIVEFKTDIPRTTQIDIENDFQELRTLMLRWQQAAVLPVVARAGGAPPLPGLGVPSGGLAGGGCNNTFPCVLRFPYYDTAAHAIAQTSATPNRHWYVVIKSAAIVVRPQVNLNVPLTYFSGTKATTGSGYVSGSPNKFVNAQFGELWATTGGWNFLLAASDTRAYYRLFGFYARKMDELAKARSDFALMFTKKSVSLSRAILANKNKLNPNIKFDFCELRNAMPSMYFALNSFFHLAGPPRLYKVINDTPRKAMQYNAPAHCPFTSSDIGLRPFLVLGTIKPLFEFRHPGANEPCFELATSYLVNGGTNLNDLSTRCNTDSSVF